jgi:hypothetical protein
MAWDREKFMKCIDRVVGIYDKSKISMPREFNPFLRLHTQLLTPDNLETNENMQDLKNWLKKSHGSLEMKRKLKTRCDFVVYDKTTHLDGRLETVTVLVSAPGVLLDLEDPTIASLYKAVLEIRIQWGIEGIVLFGVFNRQTRGLFKDICQLNLIRVDDDMLDNFVSGCSSDIYLNRGLDLQVPQYRIAFDHLDRWESMLMATLEWELPIDITMDRAIELTIEKRDLWNRIRDEISHGLGM